MDSFVVAEVHRARSVRPSLCRFGRFGASCSLVLAFAVSCAAPAEHREDVMSRMQALESPARSDVEKRALILDIVERFVPHAEAFFRASDLSEPNSGYYTAVGSGVTQPRGAGDIAFAYVTLLHAYPERAQFGGVARETLVDHTIQSIRHEALTNALSGKSYRRWGNGSWQAALEAFGWGFAAYRMWDRLDADTRALVQRVITAEADILINKPIASGEEGDTGAEDNGWNSCLPALAAVMFPEHANRAAWETATIRLAMNASSTRADQSSEDVVDGRPVREWMASVNLHPDLTLENHGFFNPIYQQVVHVDIGEAALAYGAAGHPLPEAFAFRTETIWERILGPLATDEGDLALTAGQDWISKDFQHLDYLAILATRFGREDASVLESRALDWVAKRQAAHSDGSILGQTQIGYETMLVKRLASAWWNHTLFGPSPEPLQESFELARAELAGVREFAYSDFIAARLGRAFASMSWDSARPVALVIPHAAERLDDAIFSYYAPNNLLGSANGTTGPHSCACEADRFSTAGSIGSRRFSMTAFQDGTSLLLDEGSGATFTYALEAIPGMVGDRPIWSEAGNTLGDLPGEWVNASDRLGMILRGGAGMRAAAVSGTNNQLLITGSVDTGTGHRAAVLLPWADHVRTAELAPFVRQLSVPEGWAAVAARAQDESLRWAVARFSGTPSATLELSDLRGAPIPEQEATLVNGTTRYSTSLALPASRGQTARLFVASNATLRARQLGEHAALLRNSGVRDARAVVTYVPVASGAQSKTRTLAPGEECQVRLVDGELSLAGPELEPLLTARAQLEELLGALEPAHGCDQQRRSHLAVLQRAVRTALTAVTEAISLARAVDPDTSRIAAATERAERAVASLTGLADDRQLPRELRAEVRAAAQGARAALEAAAQAFGVDSWMEALGPAQTGEPLVMRVVLLNRGQTPAQDGELSLRLPEGWIGTSSERVFRSLRAGESRTVELRLVAPTTLAAGQDVVFTSELRYRTEGRIETSSSELAIEAAPAFELVPNDAGIPLAAGGRNWATARLSSFLPHSSDFTISASGQVSASGQDQMLVEPAEQRVTVPANGSAEVTVALRSLGVTNGTGSLLWSAVAGSGASSTAQTPIGFSDDLALNALGARWPRLLASSNQPSYPAALAFDGDPATFWVSSGTAAGEGPSAAHPETLTVDFGTELPIASITMRPRVNYGPKAYTIEVSLDGSSWTEVAQVPSAPNAAVTTTLAGVVATLVRLKMTDGWDRIRPPRNVQVASFEVRAALTQ